MPLERQKRYQRKKTAEVADIGEIPPVADPKRRASCERDLLKHLVTYFPASTGLKPFSEDHNRVIARIQSCVLDGGLFAQAVYRGFAKTTIGENASIWSVSYGHRGFVPIFGADAYIAAGNIDSIKTELAENDLLYEDFPELCHPIRALEGKPQRCASQVQSWNCPKCGGEEGNDKCKQCKGAGRIRRLTHIEWNSDTIVLPTVMVPEGWGTANGPKVGAKLVHSAASGAILTARGLLGGSRGMKHKRPDGTQQRPDLVFIDDPQTDGSAKSKVQIQSRIKTIKKNILRLGGHSKKIAVVMNATVIEPDDLVIHFLDPKKSPAWQGERIKMVRKWSNAHETLWEEYRELRCTFDPNDPEDQKRAHRQANAFYKRNRKKMDAGCLVSWEHCFDPETELSAIQHAYNILIDDGPEVFASECQNEPIEEKDNNQAELLKADQIAAKVNNMPRGVLPATSSHLVVFIDPNEKVLAWVACAFGDGFDGDAVDYGTYPDQGQRYFSMKKPRNTLAKATGLAGVEARVYAGLDALTKQLMTREWGRDDGASMKPEKILIDANYGKITDIVKKFCRHSEHAAVITPSHGKFFGATSVPMREWKKKQGERVGLNWRMPPITERGQVRHVVFDTNYWKGFTHGRWATPMGGRGCLNLFGSKPKDHELFADHQAAEIAIEVEARGRKVTEFKEIPGRDNDFFDCIVGCHVAASMMGVSLKELKGDVARVRVSISEMRSRLAGGSAAPPVMAPKIVIATADETKTSADIVAAGDVRSPAPATPLASGAKRRVSISELKSRLLKKEPNV